MDTRIELNDLSVTYRVDLTQTTTLKEWVIDRMTGQHRGARVREVEALNGLNLTIEHGERVGVIGLNGAGKSTLLKVMSGILQPTAGSLKVTGTVHPLIELGAGFNPEFTGRENIYFNGALLGYSRKRVEELEDQIIDFAEIRDFIDLPVKTYSSGMQTRLAFSIASTIEPEILLLDEMLGAGDASFQVKAKERMNQLVTGANILVLVTHSLELVRSLCQRCLVLNRGVIHFDGQPDEAIALYKTLTEGRARLRNV